MYFRNLTESSYLLVSAPAHWEGNRILLNYWNANDMNFGNNLQTFVCKFVKVNERNLSKQIDKFLSL